MGRARGKLVLQPIRNDRSRKVTFQKRRFGLDKKILELSKLCDVDACMVSYGPNGELKTWPEDRSQLVSVIRRYNSVDKYERDKRKEDIASVLGSKNVNNNNNKKLEDDDQSSSSSLYPSWDSRLDDFSQNSLKDLKASLDDKLNKLGSRIQFLNNKSIKNPSSKGKGVDHDITTNNPMFFFDGTVNHMATLAPSNCYGYDAGTSRSTTYDGASGSAVPDDGFDMMELMFGTDDSCLLHHGSMIFHHQPQALQAMLPPMPMHPPPLQQQQPSVPMGSHSMQTHPPPPLQQQALVPTGPPCHCHCHCHCSRWEDGFLNFGANSFDFELDPITGRSYVEGS